jgi:hypothetical protein
MSIDPQDSVFLVTSSDPENSRFGTAFAFYWDESSTGQYEATYFLTCRHVITEAGGPKQLRIGGRLARVVTSGSDDGLDDMAVLRVEGVRDVPILNTNAAGESGSQIRVLGFRSHLQDYLIRPLRGTLGERVGLESKQQRGRVAAWDLEIEGDYELERGYSGGPIINEAGDVVAIATYRLGGRRGVALSVQALEEIWPKMIPKLKETRRFIGTPLLNVFCNKLFTSLSAEPIDAAVSQPFWRSSRMDFSAIATGEVLGYGGIAHTVYAVTQADNLSEDETMRVIKGFDSASASMFPDVRSTAHFFVFEQEPSKNVLDIIKKEHNPSIDSGADRAKRGLALTLLRHGIYKTGARIGSTVDKAEKTSSLWIVDIKQANVVRYVLRGSPTRVEKSEDQLRNMIADLKSKTGFENTPRSRDLPEP